MTKKEINRRKNFIGGLIHGTFLRVSVRLADIDVILPAFVSSITGSKFLIALLPSIYLSAGNLPQTLFANFVEPRARKKPFLYLAIFSRVFIWFAMGLVVMGVGISRPTILLSLLFFSLLIYSMTGSLGGVAYTDIIGKSIAKRSRAKFYASRQVTGSLIGIYLAAKEKRATYTGLRGTAIAITAPLPFLAGGLIQLFSFQVAFIFSSLIMATGVIVLGYNTWKETFAEG